MIVKAREDSSKYCFNVELPVSFKSLYLNWRLLGGGLLWSKDGRPQSNFFWCDWRDKQPAAKVRRRISSVYPSRSPEESLQSKGPVATWIRCPKATPWKDSWGHKTSETFVDRSKRKWLWMHLRLWVLVRYQAHRHQIVRRSKHREHPTWVRRKAWGWETRDYAGIRHKA